MNPKGGMDFTQWQNWLRGWLTRHPVKEPPENLQRDYVHQVMAKIPQKSLSEARRFVFPRVTIPRLTFGLGTAAACAVVALFFLKVSPGHIAEGPLKETNRVMLVQAVPSQDEAVRLEEELELLELLEEEGEEATSAWVDSVINEDRAAHADRVTDAELLEELKRYDQIQFEMNA